MYSSQCQYLVSMIQFFLCLISLMYIVCLCHPRYTLHLPCIFETQYKYLWIMYQISCIADLIPSSSSRLISEEIETMV